MPTHPARLPRGPPGRPADTDEIAPGIFHWTARHDPIGHTVSSHFIAGAGAVLDPKRPDGGWDQLPETPRLVLLTSGHHDRDAADCAQTFGIPIRVSEPARDYLDGELEVETFAAGEEVAPGITAIQVGVLCADEGAFHIAAGGGALAFADGVNRYGDELGFFRDSLLGDDPEAVKAGLKREYAKLLDRDFDVLLFAHGEPVASGGHDALRAFVTSPPGAVEV